MADAIASRTGVHAIVPESERPTEPDMPAVRTREDTAPSLMRAVMMAFMRGRVTPAQLGLFGLLVGSGSIGGSWLFGPGGLTDDTAVRADLAQLKLDAKAERDAAATERAAAADERKAAAADREAQAKRITELSEAVQSCEATIANVDGGQQALQEWIGDALLVHNRALDDIADKIDVRVDLRLRPMTARGGRLR